MLAHLQRHAPDAVVVFGAGALVYGTSQLSVPMAWMLGGILAMAVGLLVDMRRS